MLVTILVPVFLVMALGYLSGRWRIVDDGNVSGLIAVLMTFALPASLFLVLAKTPRHEIATHLNVVGAIVVITILTYLITFLAERRLFHNDTDSASATALTATFPNYASAGLPLASGVFGSVLGGAAAVFASLSLAVGAITISPLTLALMTGKSSDGHGAVARFARAFAATARKPVVFAPVLGLVASGVDLPLPSWATGSLTLLGNITAGLGLFTTGLMLSTVHVRLTRNLGFGVLVKNVLQPLVALAVVRLAGIDTATGNLVVLLFAIPSGFFGVVFGRGHGVKSADASSVLIVSSVLSAVTLAVGVAILAPA